MKAPSEADVVKQCLQWLKLQRIEAWRCNTGASKIGDRFIRFGKPGLPDIMGYLPLTPWATPLYVECKSAKGRLRPEQRAFLLAAEGAGCCCVVARSVDDLIAAVERFKETCR